MQLQKVERDLRARFQAEKSQNASGGRVPPFNWIMHHEICFNCIGPS